MMYYMVEFDARPGVNRAKITQAYRKFANHFQETFPEIKFIGFFARDILLGPRPNILPSGRSRITPPWTRGSGPSLPTSMVGRSAMSSTNWA